MKKLGNRRMHHQDAIGCGRGQWLPCLQHAHGVTGIARIALRASEVEASVGGFEGGALVARPLHQFTSQSALLP